MEPTKEKVPKRKRKFIGCSQLDHFELGHKVGVGTFGEVLKAKHVANGKTVALKKIFTKSEQEGFPITSLREIKLLKNVSHSNVASLIDMAVSYKADGEFKEIEDVYMVFPFMDHDLTGILENQSINLTSPQIKCYMKQLLEGISYLHSRQIMHRDLKGANLLVNNRGELKITDFGLARPLEENRIKYTPGVVTRWYRPPELLFGSDIYDESIDIWGVGCIIAEMYMRRPLFGASSDLDQLKMVCCYCGTPTEETYPGVGKLPDYSKIQLKMEKRILKEFLIGKHIDEAAVDLIDRMLVMDPKKRISAKEALEHEYFTCDPLPCLPGEIQKFESSHVYTVQLQREKEMSMNKRNRPDEHFEHDNQPNQKRAHGQRYTDYDGTRTSDSYLRTHDQIRYGDRLTPPPPPPPPMEREREYRRDDSSERKDNRDYSAQGGYRDYSAQGGYRDYSERKDHRDYSERKDHRDCNERKDHRDHSEHNEQGTYRDRREHREHNPHRDEKDYARIGPRNSHSHNRHEPPAVPTERKVFNSKPPTPEVTRRVSEAAAHERNRRAVSYDDL